MNWQIIEETTPTKIVSHTHLNMGQAISALSSSAPETFTIDELTFLEDIPDHLHLECPVCLQVRPTIRKILRKYFNLGGKPSQKSCHNTIIMRFLFCQMEIFYN